MAKKLEIITKILREGTEIGEVSVMHQKERKNFEIKKRYFSQDNEFIKMQKKMEVALRIYDTMLDNLTGHGFGIHHETFEGYFRGCGYKSKYSPGSEKKMNHNS